MTKARWAMVAAALVHLLAFLAMLGRIEPIYTHFYSIAWWTYIVFIAGINHHRGNSYLMGQPREFAWLFCFSVPSWLFFEACNFHLENWQYVGVPEAIYIRWPGYVLAYGTVLPALFETERLLRNLGLVQTSSKRPVRVSRALLNRLLLLGCLMMLSLLVRPEFLFPLLWIGLIFLLDPVLYRFDPEVSLLGRAEKGRYGLILRLLLAGLVCGFLWEFWNYWSGAKWVYTVPYFNFWKVFEMPALGYLGFPPFALEFYLLWQAFRLFRSRVLSQGRLVPALALVVAMVFCLVVFWGIDRFTLSQRFPDKTLKAFSTVGRSVWLSDSGPIAQRMTEQRFLPEGAGKVGERDGKV